MPARSAALPAATASPAPLDLKRRLLLRVTLFAMMLFLAASAVVVGLAVQRIPAEIHRTGDTIRQLIADEVARRTTAFEQHLVQIDLVGLTGVGALVHFCATLENLYSQPIAQHCFGESHRAGIGLNQGGSEVDSGPRPQRWLAQGLRYLTHDHAVYRAAVGTYPGVKIAELTLTPHYASEAALVGQQLLGLLVITFGVLLINVLVYLPVREALAPAAQILRALRRMQAGDLAVRMPRVRLQELDQIAQGFNHLAERLDATLQARKDLARRLMQVREEERRHLARELHDELGQSLASLRAEAAFVGAAAGGDQPELSVSAQAIDHTTGRMMETLHGILGRLRPTGLEEFGLSASLEHLIDDGRRRSHGQCHCTLQIEGEPDRLSDDHAVSLYRIVQEGLTNAAKHGRPTRIDVRLIHDPATGAVDLSIEDDGRVEPPLPEPAATPRHGLLGMHERVLALDGTLDIGARLPHGVRVQVHLPGHAPPMGAMRGAVGAALAMIRLLLVDDHAVVREGYRRLLERRGDLFIAAEAATAAEALLAFREHTPDVVVVDLSLPDMGGVELIQRLRQRHAQARVLAFSMHRDTLYARQALKAGALGYVTKSSAPEVLVQAVYRVARGERTLSPDIAPELALQLLDGEAHPTQTLTPREFEILRLLLSGRSAEAIAEALHISPKTAQNSHYQIKAKLGVRSDIELVRLAMKWGLVDTP